MSHRSLKQRYYKYSSPLIKQQCNHRHHQNSTKHLTNPRFWFSSLLTKPLTHFSISLNSQLIQDYIQIQASQKVHHMDQWTHHQYRYLSMKLGNLFSITIYLQLQEHIFQHNFPQTKTRKRILMMLTFLSNNILL